jgi:TatD DNase family protein
MLTIGTKLRAFEGVRKIAERYDDIWCTVGIHPHEAAEEPIEEAGALIEHAKHPRVVGIGEAGLDYYYEHSPKPDQIRNFRAHIVAARETGLPLIVHARDADDDLCQILEDESAKGAFPGLIHCFSSSAKLARTALDLGMMISLSGIVTFKKADELRAIAANVPLDRLLVETDAPYLAPMPHRGKRNEPAFVAHTAAVVAKLKNVELDRLADATTDNFFRLFKKTRRPT